MDKNKKWLELYMRLKQNEHCINSSRHSSGATQALAKEIKSYLFDCIDEHSIKIEGKYNRRYAEQMLIMPSHRGYLGTNTANDIPCRNRIALSAKA